MFTEFNKIDPLLSNAARCLAILFPWNAFEPLTDLVYLKWKLADLSGRFAVYMFDPCRIGCRRGSI